MFPQLIETPFGSYTILHTSNGANLKSVRARMRVVQIFLEPRFVFWIATFFLRAKAAFYKSASSFLWFIAFFSIDFVAWSIARLGSDRLTAMMRCALQQRTPVDVLQSQPPFLNCIITDILETLSLWKTSMEVLAFENFALTYFSPNCCKCIIEVKTF